MLNRIRLLAALAAVPARRLEREMQDEMAAHLARRTERLSARAA